MLVIIFGLGSLGTHLANTLSKAGCVVIGVSRNKPQELSDGVAHSTNEEAYARAIAHTGEFCIINTVAMTDVDHCEAHPESAYKSNFEYLIKIGELFKPLNPILVHISTDQLYDRGTLPKSEVDEVSPVNVYGYTKRMAEIYMAKWDRGITIRTNYFGRTIAGKKNNFEFIIKSIECSKEVYMTPDIVFNPINIDLLVSGITKLINKKVFGIINITSNDVVSRYELANILIKEYDQRKLSLLRSIRYEDLHFYAKRSRWMVLNNSKYTELSHTSIPALPHQIRDYLNSRET